jgi:glutamate--cysteine ligase
MARDQIDLTPIERRDELVDWIAQGAKPKSRVGGSLRAMARAG